MCYLQIKSGIAYSHITRILQPFYRVKTTEIGGYTLPMLVKSLLHWDIGQKIFSVVWLTMPIM
jgi:hypothetical protein